jgi:hypothetical protein
VDDLFPQLQSQSSPTGQIPQISAGPGRKAGSVNKRSGDLAKIIGAKWGRTPGEQMASVALVGEDAVAFYGGNVLKAMVAKAKELAYELGISPYEGWVELRLMLIALMPYVHQQQPKAITLSGGAAVGLHIVAPGMAGAPAHSNGPLLDMRPADVRLSEPSQSLSTDDVVKVADKKVADGAI